MILDTRTNDDHVRAITRWGSERLWAVGLDSGCEYGGQLSAWLLEEDRIVQVEGRSD